MIPRIATILPAALLLVACSSVQLAYRNADVLIAAYVEDLLDLDDEQVEAWRPLLDDVLARHRETELPALAALLHEVREGAADGFGEARLACVRDQAWHRWRAGAELFAEAAAPLLASLRPAQVDHLRERLREREEDFRERHLAADPDERHEARVARMVKRIEHWTGRLDGQQRALVETHVATWPPLAQGWQDYRGAKQARLLAMLESGVEAERLRPFLADWWARQAGMPPSMLQDRDRVQTGMLRMLMALQAELGAEQEEHLVAEIDSWRGSLAGLLEQGELAAAVAAVDCAPGTALAES